MAPLFGAAAGWQSGHAADCKSVYAGSIPTPASSFDVCVLASVSLLTCTFAAVVKLVDTADLKSAAREIGHAGSIPARGTRMMKVFNLSCDNDHSFEGWFASGAEFDRQLAQQMVECPVCGSHGIAKLPSAPRLSLSGAQAPVVKEPMAMSGDETMRATLLQMARHIIANTEDVGERFAEEARRIHYDEAPKRSIRGVASKNEAAELADEGIEVMPVPFGELVKRPLQ
jgi:hypothetical protein